MPFTPSSSSATRVRNLGLAGLLLTVLPTVLGATEPATEKPLGSENRPTVAEGQAELTIERLQAAPSLAGVQLRGVQLSPDGRRVTFTQARADQTTRYDLWEYEIESGTTRRLVDSELLTGGDEELSDEEKARRERQRLVGLSGIIEYSWSADGKALLFPLAGDLFLYRLDSPPEQAVTRVTETESFETDAKISPTGRFVSFVRDQNLWIVDPTTGEETAVTDDGGGTLKNGMAEFVAQEEMGRYTGYWWSPDDRFVAYARVDESPVAVTNRFEIYAEDVEIFEQRYPWTGTPNVNIELWVWDRTTGERRAIDLGAETDIYLYRVDWFPDSRHLAVQRQPRLQQGLDLLRSDVTTGESQLLIREESSIWIEPQDDLNFVSGVEEFVWSSGRSGHQHLYLFDWDGNLIRPLTAGPWSIKETGRGNKAVQGVDSDGRWVYFTAYADTPLERHLYRQSLDTEKPTEVQRLSQRAGDHQPTLATDGSVYVDLFSSATTPPQLSLHRAATGEQITWLEENALDETHPYYPYLSNHIEPEYGTLKAEDGQDLYYRIWKPDTEPGVKLPVILYVYGGPGGQKVKEGWPSTTDLWLHTMARSGYAVFSLDNRGTGGRGHDFDAPLYRAMGGVEVVDQLRGIEFVKQQAWADPERIGVFGWSYGGYMSLMLLTQSPGTFACGIAGAPVTDFRLYDTHYTERYLQRPQDNPEGYVAADVITYAERLADPLLVIHGMADDNVLFTNATKLFKVLQDLDKPFEMMTYPGAKHSLFRVPGTGPHAQRTAKAFLERCLGEGRGSRVED